MQFGMCENWTEDCVFVQSKTLNEASAWSVRSMLNFQFWRRFVSTISCASPERWLALQNADWPTSHNAIARSVLHIEIYQRLTNDEKCIKLRPVQLLLHFFQKPKKSKLFDYYQYSTPLNLCSVPIHSFRVMLLTKSTIAVFETKQMNYLHRRSASLLRRFVFSTFWLQRCGRLVLANRI